MAYQVLARKWRPQRFAEVIGQEHVARTLQNAIKEDRVGHAYLFVGSRGIGKTTAARIFAKALNCERPVADDGGHIEPCCECPTCLEIAAGNCLDVLEIDGASHNGVEDIRTIRDNVQYSPTNGRRYKIYIIDEVHMLTTQAWNALLKTLEEPPAHVKFFFATTEAHKILPTILSRCQRFDLKRIAVPLIVAHLQEIAAKESVFINDAALHIIARAAEGGMRDAQSIFDQMIAFCGGQTAVHEITETDVIDVFGLVSHGELMHLVAALLANQPGAVVSAVHHLADKGRNLERLYTDLLLAIRNLMVSQCVAEPRQMLDVSEAELADLARLAASVPGSVIQRLVDGLLAGDQQLRYTLNKRVYLEATLMRVMREAHALRIDDLISHLRRLQQGGELSALEALPPAPALVAAPPAPSAPAAPPAAPEPKAAPVPAPAPEPELGLTPDSEPPATDDDVDPDDPAPPSESPDQLLLFGGDDAGADGDPKAMVAVERADGARIWAYVIEQAERTGRDSSLITALRDAVVMSWRQGLLQLGLSETVPDETFARASSPAAYELVLPLLQKVMRGSEVKLAVQRIAQEVWQKLRETGNRRLVASPEVWASMEQNPLVLRVCEMFEGRLIDVRG